MSHVEKIAELEAELMQLRSRPLGIGDGDIQALFNQRDALRKALEELENVAGCLYPLVLMLCDDETSRPSLKVSREVVDFIRDSNILGRVRLLLRDAR